MFLIYGIIIKSKQNINNKNAILTGGVLMKKIEGILTQEEFERLSSELLLLEAEEKFDGKDNSKRIQEIKDLLND